MEAQVRQLLGRRPRARLKGLKGDGVHIALLDTWPWDSSANDPFTLLRAFSSYLDQSGDSHDLLDDFANGVIIPRDRFRDYVEQSSLAAICARSRDCAGNYREPYRIADHGLFIADILNNIAPNADVWMYRVLNDFGVLHFYSLARAVEQAIYDAKGARIVFNLSFGFGPELLLLDDLLADPTLPYTKSDTWSERLKAIAIGGRNRAGERDVLKNPAMQPMAHVFDFGCEALQRRVFAVAAAGNDACWDKPAAVAPRFPAAFPSVFAVSALGAADQVASYSNDADLKDAPRSDEPPEGAMAFGGEVSDGDLSTQGPIGLYISDNLPGANLHGFAEWSGTSFAAPVVAGLVANAWSELDEDAAAPLPRAQQAGGSSAPSVGLSTAPAGSTPSGGQPGQAVTSRSQTGAEQTRPGDTLPNARQAQPTSAGSQPSLPQIDLRPS